MVFTTRPLWLYQITQGIHITAGIACFPLLLAKLYVVFPDLFAYPPIKGLPSLLERGSIALFVSSSIVQIITGLFDTFQWYPFPFNFRQVHFALSFVIIGSLAIHIAVKLPKISRYWTHAKSYDAEGNLVLDEADVAPTASTVRAELAQHPKPLGPIVHRADRLTGRLFAWIDSAPVRGSAPEPSFPDEPSAPDQPSALDEHSALDQPGAPDNHSARAARVSRRGFVATVGIAVAALVGLTAGQSFAFLGGTNVFAPRKKGIGPGTLPINRTARAAQVTDAMVGADWILTVKRGDAISTFTREQLLAMPQREVQLPISCVEGWSQMATWRGVRLKDLTDTVGRNPREDLRLTSLEVKGGYRVTEMGHEYIEDDLTLVALQLNGETLAMDHGYPARVIAPGRPGVLQTKWLSKLEVLS
ncbi:molybdopterin-dependent oxidoreductase [Lacisediminihabitans sp. G11-30]|uniref:Molybdopterin-dependent oxidoreductase n=2 Tax=Lacisediminihabitans changchengi TaxID=2787634 RepID=A0A934SS91_9MICO|nr:molybdopterin-dependent oxidoreductase [Lacisediminihabitans changchengi]